MRYKEGQKVIIREDLQTDTIYGDGVNFVLPMQNLKRKSVRIDSVIEFTSSDEIRYRVGEWTINNAMIDEVKTKKYNSSILVIERR